MKPPNVYDATTPIERNKSIEKAVHIIGRLNSLKFMINCVAYSDPIIDFVFSWRLFASLFILSRSTWKLTSTLFPKSSLLVDTLNQPRRKPMQTVRTTRNNSTDMNRFTVINLLKKKQSLVNQRPIGKRPSSTRINKISKTNPSPPLG